MCWNDMKGVGERRGPIAIFLLFTQKSSGSCFSFQFLLDTSLTLAAGSETQRAVKNHCQAPEQKKTTNPIQNQDRPLIAARLYGEKFC